MKLHIVGETIHWLFFGVTLLYLITGFGITEYRVVEAWSFGLLSKSLSLRIHQDLLIPFVLLLILHTAQKPAKYVYARLKS